MDTSESNRISSRSKAAISTVSAATTQQLTTAASPQAAPTMAAADSFLEYPDCWTKKQFEYFQDQYPWLIIKNKKLGCKICLDIGCLGPESEKHVHLSTEWTNSSVSASGACREIQQTSLRKN